MQNGSIFCILAFLGKVVIMVIVFKLKTKTKYCFIPITYANPELVTQHSAVGTIILLFNHISYWSLIEVSRPPIYAAQSTPVLAVSWQYCAKIFVKIMPVCQDNPCQDTANTGVQNISPLQDYIQILAVLISTMGILIIKL